MYMYACLPDPVYYNRPRESCTQSIIGNTSEMVSIAAVLLCESIVMIVLSMT